MERGGTILRTARCQEFKVDKGRQEAYKILKDHEIKGLIVIGGDGSLNGAALVAAESDIKVIGLPGSIDNDISETDMCIGVDTCLNTVVENIQKLKCLHRRSSSRKQNRIRNACDHSRSYSKRRFSFRCRQTTGFPHGIGRSSSLHRWPIKCHDRNSREQHRFCRSQQGAPKEKRT